jgi:hypothetical protein
LIRSLLSHAEVRIAQVSYGMAKTGLVKNAGWGFISFTLRVLDRDQQLLQEEVQTVVVAGEL